MTDVPAQLERIERRLHKVEKQVEKHLDQSVGDLNKRDKVLLLLAAARFKRVVTNIGPVAVGVTEVPIVWPVPFGDDSYFVAIEFLVGAAAIGMLEGTVKATTRMPEGCTITVSAAQAVTAAVLDVLAIRP